MRREKVIARTSTIQRQLYKAVLALAAPAIMFVAVLLQQYVASERTRLEEQAIYISRGIASAVDREISGILTTLQALATSPSLQSGDLTAFYEQARRVNRTPGMYFSLRDLAGNNLLTTRVPFGTTVNTAALSEIDESAIATSQPTISDVYIGAVSQRPAVQIVAAPIIVEGAPKYLLGASLDASYLADAVRRENLPLGWTGAIIDRSRKIVARSEAQEEFVGKVVSSDLQQHLAETNGFYYGKNLAGRDVLAGYAPLLATRWIATANVPRNTVEAPLRRSILVLTGLGAMLACLSGIAAFSFSRPIDKAMQALRQASADTLSGRPVSAVASDIVEVNDVGRALVDASSTIRSREIDLQRSEIRVLDAEARSEQIMSSATDYAVITTDLSGAITGWNTGAQEIFGWRNDEIQNENIALIFTEEDRSNCVPEREMGLALAVGRAPDERWHRRKDNGAFFAVGALLCLRTKSGELNGFVKILSDRTEHERMVSTIRELNTGLEQRVQDRTRELEVANARLVEEATRRELAEEQLRQAQKMEAVGRLTGGVAHDFNNLLTIITGSLDMLRRRMSSDGIIQDTRVIRLIDQAIEGASRAAALTYRLLAFSRQQPLAPEPVDANKLVAGMSDLLRRTLGENIAVETVLAGGLWRTHADPNQLENAILNLAVNARDAMPDGGKLAIETANAHLDEDYARHYPEVTAGQYVMIAVCDTGAGIDAHALPKVFEPFFTTKAVGKGTGLGLSQVYGFAKQSNGHAAIYSELGHGTTVKVYLPRFRQSGALSEAMQPSGFTPHPATSLVRAAAAETILVIEDEPMVRAFSVSALEEAGYRVVAAEDGPSGLALLDGNPEVRLLFTDVVLTGPMNGRKVADEALRRRPDLKVLFTTGYTRNAIIHHGRLDEGVELLGKPFTATSLALKLRYLLSGQST